MDNPILAVIVIAAALILALFGAADMSKTVYTCEKCGHRFRAPWYKFYLSGHYGEDKVLRCPKCDKRSRCVVSYDQKL